MDDLRKQLERQMLIEQVQRQEVGSKLTITEEEARQYYAQHPDEFTDPASITLREILIEVPAAGQRRRERRGGRRGAEEGRRRSARARLKGEDFAKLATELSDVVRRRPTAASSGRSRTTTCRRSCRRWSTR